MVNAVNSVGTPNGYGNIQRLCSDNDNRVIYSVKDSSGQVAGNISVAASDVDKFEKSFSDIMATAPIIQEYYSTHSPEQEAKKRSILLPTLVGTGGVAGLLLPLMLMKKSGNIKKIVTTAISTIAGLAAGIAAYIAATTPPGTIKFTKAAKNLSNMDIRPVDDTTKCRATRM